MSLWAPVQLDIEAVHRSILITIDFYLESRPGVADRRFERTHLGCLGLWRPAAVDIYGHSDSNENGGAWRREGAAVSPPHD